MVISVPRKEHKAAEIVSGVWKLIRLKLLMDEGME
jgi:hypothetical protein